MENLELFTTWMIKAENRAACINEALKDFEERVLDGNFEESDLIKIAVIISDLESLLAKINVR